MKKIIFALLTLLILTENSNAKDNYRINATPIIFNKLIFQETGSKKQIREIHIEKILISKSNLLNDIAAKKITKSLRKLSEDFYMDAKDWCPPPHNGPWGYEVKLDTIYYIDMHLSIVFNSSTSCYGNLIMNKIAKTYSTKNGNEIAPEELIAEFAPPLLKDEISKKDDYIKLGEYGFEFLLSENKNIYSEDVEPDCISYLKNSYYSIWIRPGYLILQPLFQHTQSICHRDLSIKFNSPAQNTEK